MPGSALLLASLLLPFSFFLFPAPAAGDAAPLALTGYRLPSPGGTRATVLRREGPWHNNQVDLNVWVGEDQFEAGLVVAAKPGIVRFVKDVSPDAAGGCPWVACWKRANLVIIEHGPEEYSWYLHLAHASVPEQIQPGTHVGWGTVVGREGQTGWAVGEHLHFMASLDLPELTDPSDPNDLPWPQAIVPVDFLEAGWADLHRGATFTSQNYP